MAKKLQGVTGEYPDLEPIPTNESRNWHPEDQRLRDHGFEIVSRKEGRVAVWRLAKNRAVEMTHDEALEFVADEEAAKAEQR